MHIADRGVVGQQHGGGQVVGLLQPAPALERLGIVGIEQDDIGLVDLIGRNQVVVFLELRRERKDALEHPNLEIAQTDMTQKYAVVHA